jgi:hypothetical protein
MNITSYLFRFTIAGVAIILGISAQQTFQKLDRITRNWFDSAATSVKKDLPFQGMFEKLLGSQKTWHGTSSDLTGEYYLPEEVVAGEFNDFARIEFTMHDYPRGAPILPSGAVYSDLTYRFATITMDGDTLTFETEAKGGVSYRFNGKVGRSDTQEQECSTGDLVGRLEKFKNGSSVASIDSTFFLFQ